jgi:hypothetical protein
MRRSGHALIAWESAFLAPPFFSPEEGWEGIAPREKAESKV